MKLTYKKGKQDKIHISVDGEYSFTVDEAYFLSLGLYNGKELEAGEIDELKEKIAFRRAYNCAVGLLARRDHSKKELTEKLRQKGYGAMAEKTLERLISEGFVDDERFALLYAKELRRLKKYGKRRILQELYRKGISKDIADVALEELSFEENELTELIIKKYSRYLSDEKGINKTVNSLLRLGYSYGEIRDALKKINDGEDIFDEEVIYE